MQTWTGRLPASLTTLVIRQSHLATLPTILHSDVPSSLATLYIEASPIRMLHDTVATSWQSLLELVLDNVSFADGAPSLAVTNLSRLSYHSLRFNWLTRVSMTWQSLAQAQMLALNQMDLSGSQLAEGPWSWWAAQTSHETMTSALSLRTNPIAALPLTVDISSLTNRQLVLDDTAYCTETEPRPLFCLDSFCAPACLLSMVGDHLCDSACFNVACAYDKDDCTSIGLEADQI
ncbi:Aste57867_10997 [Aphanomyces stellatus]|uniref:Aste57867_10997 protein n=1 Tax=Aphanomyces stellatus TaxID=120398 RepID=A0A485KRR3_9STRA|nr:hypothetical protein As57867_010956 [Aphanomyces stellatus]VFT87865.1 Aste57867_10997 [Aphanomyces stellatus]